MIRRFFFISLNMVLTERLVDVDFNVSRGKLCQYAVYFDNRLHERTEKYILHFDIIHKALFILKTKPNIKLQQLKNHYILYGLY